MFIFSLQQEKQLLELRRWVVPRLLICVRACVYVCVCVTASLQLGTWHMSLGLRNRRRQSHFDGKAQARRACTHIRRQSNLAVRNRWGNKLYGKDIKWYIDSQKIHLVYTMRQQTYHTLVL